jgi:hypothetical protein
LNRVLHAWRGNEVPLQGTRRAVPDQTTGVLSAHRNVTGKGNAGSSGSGMSPASVKGPAEPVFCQSGGPFTLASDKEWVREDSLIRGEPQRSPITTLTQCRVAKVDLAVCAGHRRGVTAVAGVTGVICGRDGCCGGSP